MRAVLGITSRATGTLITSTTNMWLLTLPLQRLSSRSSVNPRMLFGAQQPVQLEQLTLGLGSVVADGVHMPCQHSAFALPSAVPPAPLVLADPLEATGPLLNAAELAGAVALIRRGGCSFEEKLRRASECNAAAVSQGSGSGQGWGWGWG